MMDEREQECITPEQPARIDRGDFLKWAALVGLSPALLETLARDPRAALAAGARQTAVAATSTFTPVRPPATPLAVRAPYLSTWQFADNLPGTWSTFWNGVVKAIAGIARIDGAPYVFCGNPGNNTPIAPPMTQTNLTVTPTRSIYTLQAGGVTLTVTFLSPVEANDLRRLSMPLSYIFVQAQSNDGASHQVSVYLDITGEWAHPNPTALVNWGRQQAAASRGSITCTSIIRPGASPRWRPRTRPT